MEVLSVLSVVVFELSPNILLYVSVSVEVFSVLSVHSVVVFLTVT